MRRARKARFRQYHSILLRGLSQVRAAKPGDYFRCGDSPWLQCEECDLLALGKWCGRSLR